jgi:hypothetical protein
MPPKHQDTKYHRKVIANQITLVCFGVFVLLWQGIKVYGQDHIPEELLPPSNIEVNATTGRAIWQLPRSILFFEDFESGSFPPSGWSASSFGKGWMKSGIQPFQTWKVPENGSHFALANDDSASVQNNGSMDLLVSPVIDLTVADSCRLSFRSFFTGAYGQSASVEYRLSELSPWIELFKPEGDFDWIHVNVDLTAFSGPEGEATFQLAFHADDRGNHASGLAVDDIEISGKVDPAIPYDYLIFLDNAKIDSTEGFSYALPLTYYGEDHEFGISARYEGGNSDTARIEYESRYLPPPAYIDVYYWGGDEASVYWEKPDPLYLCDAFELQFDFATESLGIEGGCETDGEFIYVCYEYSNRIDKYDLEGNLAETFNIPGIPGLYDLAYDPWDELMYGGHGGYTIYQMDFKNKTLVDQITAPVEVRGLAIDNYTFWANNLSSDITRFDIDGYIWESFPVGDIGNYYGLAYDWSEEEPKLWGISSDCTGRLLVQYDIYSGQRTGLTYDVTYLAENNGMAGGLFIMEDIVENCITIGGNLKNDVVFGLALHDYISSEWDPPGLDHYMLYNQDTLIYSGSNENIGILFGETMLNNYKLEVSAVYDLGAFGYPGQFAESGRTGPAYLYPFGCLDLDFEEDWSSESFNTNDWDVEGQSWSIHAALGNPPPSAIFHDISGSGQYDQTLTSPCIFIGAADSCTISLVYDIRSIDSSPTGLQTLAVEIYNVLDDNWQELRAYHNDTVMPHFLSDTIQLNPILYSDVLKIRFHVFGSDLVDNPFWSIDNIRVTRICLPPFNLTAEIAEDLESVYVSWQNPYAGSEEWIHYDDSLKYTNAGFDAGPENWYDVAARWDNSSIRGFNHYEITRLAFIPTMTEASYVMKIWTGSAAGKLVYERIMTDLVPDEWNIMEVSPPLPVDIISDLWIGYSCSSRGGYPFAMDQGPAVDGYGNMIRVDSIWTSMLTINPELNYNFNIRAELVKEPGPVKPFQLYRSIGNWPFQHIATTGNNSVTLPSASTTEEQCFRSRLICFNHAEMIIVSDFSGTDCVLPVSLPETPDEEDAINIYPNPTGGALSIQSAQQIQMIELYDGQGKLIQSFSLTPGQDLINLNSYSPGIYLLRIETAKGWEYRKIIVIR